MLDKPEFWVYTIFILDVEIKRALVGYISIQKVPINGGVLRQQHITVFLLAAVMPRKGAWPLFMLRKEFLRVSQRIAGSALTLPFCGAIIKVTGYLCVKLILLLKGA